jgi:hypothetical protein
MGLSENLNVPCLPFYEWLIAFSYSMNKSELLQIASCLGDEKDQSTIKLALKLLDLDIESAAKLVAQTLKTIEIGRANEHVILRKKIWGAVYGV